MGQVIKKRAEKLRFLIVGGFNTALDFAILLLLTSFGMDKIVANYIATGVAFVFSFVLNKNYTFNVKGGDIRRQVILFTAVTLTGLWILQPIVIVVSGLVLELFIDNQPTILIISKLLATTVSLVWNYVFYSRLVFRKA